MANVVSARANFVGTLHPWLAGGFVLVELGTVPTPVSVTFLFIFSFETAITLAVVVAGAVVVIHRFSSCKCTRRFVKVTVTAIVVVGKLTI